jgi:hypothetical protein
MVKAEINLVNVISYFQGNLRYKLYYSKNWKWLIRQHILEQIDFRIKVMEPRCLSEGSCMLCGCTTTALQMAFKSCDKPCYPELMGKDRWERFQSGYPTMDSHGYWKWDHYLSKLTFIPNEKNK